MLAIIAVSCKKSTDGDNTLELFAEGLKNPVAIVHAGDSRIFVAEQEGIIVILDSAGNDTGTFLNLTDKVVFGGERGLIGLAFHPGYKTNGYLYVHYTGEGDSTRIARFSVSNDDPDKADSLSEFTVLTLKQPYGNHNGGQLAFGPDGFLYIALGDGGSQGDPHNRAQNRKVLFGKILRIDVDGGSPYAIPSSNPFVNDTSALPHIWSYGLRNPWRFSFDEETGDMWIGDVGESDVEEINFAEAGGSGGINYGWRCYEGDEPFDQEGCDTMQSFESPVHSYAHGLECTVIGGYVFRGKERSPYYGKYFFADFCSDQIWTLRKPAGGAWVAEEYGQFPGNNFSTFGVDKNGAMYIAGYTTGRIFRLPL
jgi:glucose/arabinose dehydrogenase